MSNPCHVELVLQEEEVSIKKQDKAVVRLSKKRLVRQRTIA
jgi:hypothetical protein